MPHIHEKVDFCVEVFIVYKDKVLLRMHDKHKIWLSVGGHIELDEDPVQAGYREVKEEVGLDIEIVGDAEGPNPGEVINQHYSYLIPPRYMGRHPVSDTHTHIPLVYFARAKNDNVSISEMEHERTDTKWFTMKDLENANLVPNVLFYASEALKELGEK